jgi:thiol-disulfide isomerase/thioredoxin
VSKKKNRNKGKQTKQAKKSPSALARFQELSPNKKRRFILKSLLGAGVLGGGGVALAAYDKRQKTLHDLTVVGKGVPVIVQVHDPSCPKCRRLKSRTEKVLENYPDDTVLYRLADVNTPAGRRLQAMYNSPTVTLLMFDANGSHQGTVQGVRPIEDIKAVVDRLF